MRDDPEATYKRLIERRDLFGLNDDRALEQLELLQDLHLRSSQAPTMVLFGMGAPAGERLVNVRRRCVQVSSDGGFFSMCS